MLIKYNLLIIAAKNIRNRAILRLVLDELNWMTKRQGLKS